MMLRLTTLLPFVFLLLSAGCVEQQHQYSRNGIDYGVVEGSFRGRWWNYYERGRSFGEGEFHREAIADLDKAIQAREEDSWRARTYGMHFVDYFPHRELGIVYYQQGKYEQAVAELLSSLETAPSAKAAFFLNKARKSRLEQNKNDRQPPELSIYFPDGAEVTNQFTATVSGTVKDDTFVASILVEGKNQPVELAQPELSFTAEVPLKEGHNRITVRATDIVGHSTDTTLVLYADHRGPLIQLEKISLAGPGIHLSGSLNDEGGLGSFLINGREQTVPDGSRMYRFSLELDPGEITLQASDRAGNMTTAYVSPDFIANRPMPLFAALDQSRGSGRIVSDVGSGMFVATGPGSTDRLPPRISFRNLAKGETTFDEVFLLEGEANDISGLQALTIDQEAVLKKGGQKAYFSVLKQLQPGENSFLVTAVDSHGNKVDRLVVVTRKVQKIRQVGSRMSIAVLPFEKKGQASLLDDILYDKLVDSFLEQKRFQLVERKELDHVLQELKLSAAELTDPDHALQVGKLLSAHALLSGTVIETNDAVEVVARLIDTETATVISSNDVFDQDKSLRALDRLWDRLAYKFKRDFPLLEGILLEVVNGEALVDLGTSKNLRLYSRLICFREGKEIRHPVTGKLLGAEAEILADLKVVKVDKEFSRVEIVHWAGEMQQLDKVISR